MNKGNILIFTGEGHGKSPAALGTALKAASMGESTVIIQFMKGKGLGESDYLRKLEPEIKLFRFEKSEGDFLNLPEDEKREQIANIRNGMHFARKVIMTGECDLLVLDEVLGLVDNEIISVQELKDLINLKPDKMQLVMTGITLRDDIKELADEVSIIERGQK